MMVIQFPVLVALFSSGCAMISAESSALKDTPLEVGAEKQLFIDKRFISSSHNVNLHMNHAEKIGKIIKGTQKPYLNYPAMVLNVFEDNGIYKLYYGCHTGGGHTLAYAESSDAINWKQPNLGLIDLAGSTDNNMIFRGEYAAFAYVFKDAHESDPAKRYKAFWPKWTPGKPFNPAHDGIYAYYSSDGIQFIEAGQVLPKFPDNPPIVHWDKRIGKYVIYTRVFDLSVENKRKIGRIETDDCLAPWPYNSSNDSSWLLSTHHISTVLEADNHIAPYSDYYYNSATIYPYADDVYLMFLTPFRHFGPSRQPEFYKHVETREDFGLIEIQLAISRDGINWTRPFYEPYIRTGTTREWDRWLITSGPNVIRRGNYIYHYYCSSSRTHDSALLRPEYYYDDDPDLPDDPVNNLFVARQRLDGFVSVDAPIQGGWVLTPPLVFTGSCLRLNIDTGALGTAFIELRDADNNAISGYTLDACEEIGGNFVDVRVRWKGKHDLSALAGKTVRIYIKMRAAKLYAFQFANE
jgi:hypothetical protein